MPQPGRPLEAVFKLKRATPLSQPPRITMLDFLLAIVSHVRRPIPLVGLRVVGLSDERNPAAAPGRRSVTRMTQPRIG